jgi:hypothetical protein
MIFGNSVHHPGGTRRDADHAVMSERHGFAARDSMGIALSIACRENGVAPGRTLEQFYSARCLGVVQPVCQATQLTGTSPLKGEDALEHEPLGVRPRAVEEDAVATSCCAKGSYAPAVAHRSSPGAIRRACVVQAWG